MDRSRVKVFIKERSWIARLAAFHLGAKSGLAIVFFRTIYLHNMSRADFLQNSPLLRHEVKHIMQYKQHTYALFLLKYIWFSFKYGYDQNPFEVEAREAEQHETSLSQVQIH